MHNFRQTVRRHLSERIGSCFFVLVLFVVGVAFGAVAVRSLSFSQKQDLLSFLQQVFSLGTGLSTGSTGFLSTLLINQEMLWVVWLMGILIFGLPVIILVVFFRGFVLGFSVAFLLLEMSWKGALFALCSVIPHNLISVPATLWAAALCIDHAVSAITPAKERRRPSYWQRTVALTSATLACSALVLLASFVETYVTPVLASLAARLF